MTRGMKWALFLAICLVNGVIAGELFPPSQMTWWQQAYLLFGFFVFAHLLSGPILRA